MEGPVKEKKLKVSGRAAERKRLTGLGERGPNERIFKAWNRGGLTSEGVEVTGKWRLCKKKYWMKLVTELEST